MSDESTSYLNRRIADLERQLAESNAEAKKRRIEAKKLKGELEEITTGFTALDAEHTSLKTAAQASPGEWQAKYEALAGQVRDRDHKDAFAKLAAEAKVRPEAIDDLFALSGYKAEGDQVDETKLKGLIGEAVKARPYLLHDGAETARDAAGAAKKTAETLTLAGRSDVGRAARDTQTVSRVTYRKEDLQAPGWQSRNPHLAEAFQAGTAVLVD